MKLTEPLTAILYITADKEHIEELQHVIHVKEVVEGSSFPPSPISNQQNYFDFSRLHM